MTAEFTPKRRQNAIRKRISLPRPEFLQQGKDQDRGGKKRNLFLIFAETLNLSPSGSRENGGGPTFVLTRIV